MFTKNQLKQLEDQGLTLSDIEKQLSCFEYGFPPLNLISAATPSNGIEVLSEEDIFRYIIVYENFLFSGLKAMKFIPASGAASRMFTNLFNFLANATDEEIANKLVETDEYLQLFFNNFEKFAFYQSLKPTLQNKDSKIELVNKLLFTNGLNYANKPKGQILFHKYKDEIRTPFEEHLVETISYCTGSDGISKIHFTVSPEHLEGYEKLLDTVKTTYQKRYGVHLDVSFSFQHTSTNTIAVDEKNVPINDPDGNLIFRPGGHGALIENLGEQDSDLIFIKNIDNIVPDRLKSETKQFKKAMAGYLITVRNKIFDFSEKLDHQESLVNESLLSKIEVFLKKELKLNFANNFVSDSERVQFLKTILNRPIRICGMVKNEGEPGGGPFWVKSENGITSLQIVESAQIDKSIESHLSCFNQSTHFNPVDIVCSIVDYKGNKFNLNDFVDTNTGFITVKSVNGRTIKALELPGLWNGSMSNWTTIFVEVPNATFNPVKNINDLLRPQHQ